MLLKDKEKYIRRCFQLAEKYRGYTSPNPLVGAVLVKDGMVVGEGAHEVYGGPHAEVNAINNAKQSVKGATLFCNLEPCSHTAKQTPPCAQRIIQEKIAKVIIANIDPNPQVAGNGVALLRKAGIEVEVGILSQQGLEINEVFFKVMQENLPFVLLKTAQTLDGKVALPDGSAKWITSEAARKEVHKLRRHFDAVCVGRNTMELDNARLTSRTSENEIFCPYRIIVGKLVDPKTPYDLLNDSWPEKNVFLTHLSSEEDKKRAKVYEEMGMTVIHLPKKEDGTLDLEEGFRQVKEMKITSIMVEGGPTLATHLLKQKMVDKLKVYIAPKIMGEGISSFLDLGVRQMDRTFQLEKIQMDVLDRQAVITGYPQYLAGEN